MENPMKSPKQSKSAFNSPVLNAKTQNLEGDGSLDLQKDCFAQGSQRDCFIEPILQENPNRFTLFPIQKPKLYQKYKNHVAKINNNIIICCTRNPSYTIRFDICHLIKINI
jgi:hypothetical protein